MQQLEEEKGEVMNSVPESYHELSRMLKVLGIIDEIVDSAMESITHLEKYFGSEIVKSSCTQ